MVWFSNDYNHVRTPEAYVFFTLIGSTVIHRLLYELCYRYIAPLLPKQKEDKKDWFMLLSSYLVSTAHAFLSLALAVFVCIGETQFSDHSQSLIGKSFVTTVSIAWSLGYYFYDIQMVAKEYPKLGEYPVIVHHIMYILGALAIVFYDHGYFIMVLFNLTEASTPFVNVRWFLSETGLDSKFSLVYAVNGILMWLMFGVCRIYMCVWVFPAYLWIGQWLHLSRFPRFMICYALLLYAGISALNLFWYYKITMGLVKVVKGLLNKSGSSGGSSSGSSGNRSSISSGSRAAVGNSKKEQ